MDYQYSYDSGAGDALGLIGASIGVLLVVAVITIAFSLFTCYCMGKMFSKAGKPVWYAFIPGLNLYTKAEIAFGHQYAYVGLLIFLPLVVALVSWIPIIGWIAALVIDIGAIVLGFIIEYSFISRYTGGGALPIVGCFANWLAYIIVGMSGYNYYGPSNYVPLFTFLPAVGAATSGNYQGGMNNQYNYSSQTYQGPQGMNNNGYGQQTQGQTAGNNQNINLNKNQNQGQAGYGQQGQNWSQQGQQGQNNWGQQGYGQSGQQNNFGAAGYGQRPQGQTGYNPNMNGYGQQGFGQQPQNQGFGQRPAQNNPQGNGQGYNPNMNMGGYGYGQQPRQ